jgi:hypothetical protein
MPGESYVPLTKDVKMRTSQRARFRSTGDAATLGAE